MCCCSQRQGHYAHGHHAHGSCGCGSRHQSCGEKGRPEPNLHQVVQNLQARVQAVEEQLAVQEAE
jgi:hypothetical protein